MTLNNSGPADFRVLVDEILELLRARERPGSVRDLLPDQPLPSLLDRCHQIVARNAQRELVPIRTLHHLACTGGTLISRCIAAMPNVRLLSEVDPLSPLMASVTFVPSDVIRLSRYASRPVTTDTEVKIFLAGLEVVLRDSQREGLALVLRDHSHGMFNYSVSSLDRQTLREIVGGLAPLRSLLTVRHPLDSFLSLVKMGWHKHFQPDTLEEYCRRYGQFLDRYADLVPMRYEDFIDAPEEQMRWICTQLDLTYDDSFLHTFQVVTMSGDSGRKGNSIRKHPRRPIPDEIAAQIPKSAAYAALCEHLGYTM